MNTDAILKKYGYENVIRFRAVYPEIIKYIRFEGTTDSIKNGQLIDPRAVSPEILDILLEADMVVVVTTVARFWYVFQTPESSKPVIHPTPITEENADQLITLGGYTVLSKTPA